MVVFRTLSWLCPLRCKVTPIRGRNGGRKPKLDAAGIRQLKAMHKDRSLSIREICKRMEIGKTAFYRYLTQA